MGQAALLRSFALGWCETHLGWMLLSSVSAIGYDADPKALNLLKPTLCSKKFDAASASLLRAAGLVLSTANSPLACPVRRLLCSAIFYSLVYVQNLEVAPRLMGLRRM